MARYKRVLACAIAAVALCPPAWHIVTLLATFRTRVAFPGDIEWMEGAHVYHAYRVVHGMYLYGDPARGFATFPYPPLYWAIVGAVSTVFGLDYATGRAVSIACLAATAAILAAVVARHAKTRGAAALCAFLAVAGIAAGFERAGGSYDLARADAMAIFFPVLAAAIAGDGRLEARRAVAVALALTAAIYTKQTSVFFALWLIGFAFVRDRRGGVVLAAATGGLSLALLVALCVETNGWFWKWMFDQAHHDLNASAWANGIGIFLTHAPFLLLLPWRVVTLRAQGKLGPVQIKWVGLLGAAVVASLVPYSKVGGWVNVLIPVFVLSWPTALLLFDARKLSSIVTAGVIFLFLKYDASRFVPDEARWRDAAKLDAIVRALDGDVVVTTSPFLAVRAGKGREQPILQGFADAEHGGIHADYVDALDKSGARWVITTGRAVDGQIVERLGAKFERVRDLDVHLESLSDWDHPAPPTLWRRR